MTIKVYTDGSCKANGKAISQGGVGVYFSHLNPKNKSLSYESARDRFYDNYSIVENIGVATNNKTELLAILIALEECKEDLENGVDVMVYSDSRYSINCCTNWPLLWEKKDWKTSVGKDVLNKTLIKTIFDEFIQKYKGLITFEHVRSHTKKPSDFDPLYETWLGNYEADRLAVIGGNV